MTINRENYESVFLMAVDNELSARDRDMLNDFLNNNTDLQKEFNQLQNSILPSEEIIFNRKNNLIKPIFIEPEIEEKILLFIDNELDEEKENDLKFKIKTDEKISAAVNIFKQTKLIPEPEIIFTNKKLLYKKEVSKVIPSGWWKLAVAAIFIGFVLWGAVRYIPVSKQTLLNELASKTSLQKVTNKSAEINTITHILPAKPEPSNHLMKEDAEAVKPETASAKHIKKQPVLIINEALNTGQKLNKPNEKFSDTQDEKTSNNDLSDLQKLIEKNINNEFNKPVKNQIAEPQNKVYTASLIENKDVDKESHFSFTNEEEPKKSRLSGFLRKAKRILERNTKMKESNENLKVANFEFATQ